MPDKSTDLIQGTLEMLILKTLALEPMHGYGVACASSRPATASSASTPAPSSPPSPASSAPAASRPSGAPPRTTAAPSTTSSPTAAEKPLRRRPSNGAAS